MLISVCTPTHNPTWLLEAYVSLREQTYTDWEWILVLSDEVRRENIPQEIRANPKVRFFQTKRDTIGGVKNFAFRKARGDLLVEFDHDDWLLPTCLAKLAKAYEEKPHGFYYSNFLNVNEEGAEVTFSDQYGWEGQPVIWRGRNYTGMRSAAASARTLCEIYYAPNHVRAWSKEAYARAGGHDVLLEVGDDHDLMCRTYLAGVEFVHLDEVLYVYRMHRNTVILKQDKIAAQVVKNRSAYLVPLIVEESRRRKLALMDLSPDNVKIKDWDYFEPDDLYKLADNSVGCFRMNDRLQLLKPEEIVPLMNNVWDKLAPGGWFVTSTPAVDDPDGKVGRGAFQDPRHLSKWSANNFWYFTKAEFIRNLPELRARFQLVQTWHGYPSEWHKDVRIPYITADLCALKGQPVQGFDESRTT